jgi:hypothetical protein
VVEYLRVLDHVGFFAFGEAAVATNRDERMHVIYFLILLLLLGAVGVFTLQNYKVVSLKYRDRSVSCPLSFDRHRLSTGHGERLDSDGFRAALGSTGLGTSIALKRRVFAATLGYVNTIDLSLVVERLVQIVPG